MNIRVLGAFGSEGPGQRPSAFLVNDRTLVDAGSVAGGIPLSEQLGIQQIFLTHAHLDHVVGAAFLIETFATCDVQRAITLAALPVVVDAVRTGIFNNVIWPDFSAIPRECPAVVYRPLVAGTPHRIGGPPVTPVALHHTVPTAGVLRHHR